MPSDSPELTRELLTLWQEQLAQKDAQIANLTSLLQDATSRLSSQQKLLENFLTMHNGSAFTPLSSDAPHEQAQISDGAPTSELCSEAVVEDAAVAIREVYNTSTASGANLVRLYETESPRETPTAAPERAPISMSYFGAPMVGMARAVTTAAGNGVNLEGDSADDPPVGLLEPPVMDPSLSDPSHSPFESPKSFPARVSNLIPGKRMPHSLLWILSAVIVTVLAVGGGLWWKSAHGPASNNTSLPSRFTEKTASEMPVVPHNAPGMSGLSVDAQRKTDNSVVTPDPVASMPTPDGGQNESAAAHRTAVPPLPSPGDLPALNAVLVTAARDAEVPRIQALLALGADVNARNAQGATALMVAARHGNLPVVEALPVHGADVNATNSDGWNALMLASRYNQVPTMNSLIKRGARVNDNNQKGYTALMLAAQEGYKDAVSLLLANGADVGRRNGTGQTARDLAAVNGHDDTAGLLSAEAGK